MSFSALHRAESALYKIEYIRMLSEPRLVHHLFARRPHPQHDRAALLFLRRSPRLIGSTRQQLHHDYKPHHILRDCSPTPFTASESSATGDASGVASRVRSKSEGWTPQLS